MRDESHRMHLSTIVSDDFGAQGIISLIQSICQEGKFITKTPRLCTVSDDTEPETRNVFSTCLDSNPRATAVFAEVGDHVEVVSVFPTGTAREDVPPIEATLTADEWGNGVEADINAHIDEDTDITFFSTDYLKIGHIVADKKYQVDLCAFAYVCKIVDQPSFSLTDAPWFKTVYGDAVKEGEAVTFNTATMVEYIPLGEEFPASAEFQTPVIAIDECSILGTPMYRMKVKVASEDMNSTDVFATLYAKKEMFSVKPEVGTPIKGILWMTGNLR